MSTLTKERFLDICHFRRPGDLCLSTNLNVFNQATLTEWVKQGAPDYFGTSSGYRFYKTPVQKYFKLETCRWLYEIYSGTAGGVLAGKGFASLSMPFYERKVIDEDERTVTVINPNGQTIKVFKDDPGYTMPMFVDWPVKDRASWKEYKRNLNPATPERYPANWNAYVQEINGLTCPLSMEVGGFFGYIREWVGVERVLYMFYDDPGLVEDMMDTVLDLETEIIKRVSKDIKLEMVTYWEDMAYKAGPLISPDMFRKFMMPRYKKLNELLHSIGVDVIFVDSDGNLDLLIPLWLECGVNFVWPLEVAAGNDAVALRKKYGKDLIMGGAIDKRALSKGKEAIKEEVMSKVPFLLEKGGYFPSLDHWVPPNVSFENFCYCINLLREIGGLEKLAF
jgi:hypothetical protein